MLGDFDISKTHLIMKFQAGIGKNFLVGSEGLLFEEGMIDSGNLRLIRFHEHVDHRVLHCMINF